MYGAIKNALVTRPGLIRGLVRPRSNSNNSSNATYLTLDSSYLINAIDLCSTNSDHRSIKNDYIRCDEMNDNYKPIDNTIISKDFITPDEWNKGILNTEITFNVENKDLFDIRRVTVKAGTRVYIRDLMKDGIQRQGIRIAYSDSTIVDPNTRPEKRVLQYRRRDGSFFRLPAAAKPSAAIANWTTIRAIGGKRKSRKPAKKVKRRRTHRRN